jgi:hypothetical protein
LYLHGQAASRERCAGQEELQRCDSVDLTCLCTNTRWPLVSGSAVELSAPNTAVRHGDGDR